MIIENISSAVVVPSWLSLVRNRIWIVIEALRVNWPQLKFKQRTRIGGRMPEFRNFHCCNLCLVDLDTKVDRLIDE